MLKIGSKAPAFKLEASTGGEISLKDLQGQNVVIVFYPKNNTPGCDLQLTTLETYKNKFDAANTFVMAINSASIKAHLNYCSNKGFSFPILSDPGEVILAKYKSQKEEGKGVLRTVYAINEEGKVVFAERGQASYDDILAVLTAK